jgi:stage II sporulation protein M
MKRTNFYRHPWKFRSFLDKKSFFEALHNNRGLIVLSVLLLCGMVFGAIFARSAGSGALEKLDFLFSSNYKARISQPWTSVFMASLASSFVFILFCFLCGLSMWGMFCIPAIPFFRGFGLGLTSGYLYAAYGFKGILFNAVIIIPGAFVCILSILFAAREGIQFSKKIAACGVMIEKGHSWPPLKAYFSHFGVVIVIAFAAAVIDLIMAVCFAGIFSF